MKSSRAGRGARWSGGSVRRRHYCAEAHWYADVDATSHLRHPRDTEHEATLLPLNVIDFVWQQQSKQTTTTMQRSKLLPTESPRHVAERATLLHDLIARRTMTRTH